MPFLGVSGIQVVRKHDAKSRDPTVVDASFDVKRILPPLVRSTQNATQATFTVASRTTVECS